MIVDSSALIAILRNEPDAALYAGRIAATADCRISAANWLETAIVIDGSRDPIASRKFDEFIRAARMRIEPVTESQAKLAREAYRDFGRGSGHPAKLNFGDCFAYAASKDIGQPLLFKGADFTHTDVEAVKTQPTTAS
jgi:ribonuclease VapC